MDRENIQKAAHLEQLAHMPGKVAERELCRLPFGFVGRNQKSPERGAGEVKHSSEINQDRFLAG
jgi:hypothetical protein